MGCVDEAFQPLRQPVIAPRLPPVAVHALRYHHPASVVRDDEAMQIKVEAVLDGSAVNLRDQAARPGQRSPVKADALTDRNELVRGCSAVLTAATTDVDAEFPR